MPGMTSTRPRAKTELAPRWRMDADDYVTSADVSPDGRRAAIGTGSGRVLVLEVESGSACWDASLHPEGVLEVAFAPDGEALASCGQDGVARIHSSSGPALSELPGATGWVEHVAWAPDGQRIAIASGRMVRVFMRTGEPVLETGPLSSTVTAIAWHPVNGRELAAASYGGVHVWTLASGAPARHLPFKGSLISLAWSPDGEVVACASQDCSIHFWRLASGKDAEMSGYRFKTKALAWDAHSRLLATAGDAVITVWDFGGKGPEGTRPLQLDGHQALCTKLAFSPRKGVLASGAQDMSILLWEPRRGLTPTRFAFLEDEITALAWHPHHRGLLGADASGNVAFWATE